jgi:hypothetical protein
MASACPKNSWNEDVVDVGDREHTGRLADRLIGVTGIELDGSGLMYE